jgi:cytochrome c
MKDLELTKIAAAVFLTGIIGMSISLVVNGLYGNEEGHHGEEAKRGYQIEVAEEAAGGGGAATEAAPVDIAAFFKDATVAKGEALSKACLACHDFSKGGPNKVGPNLYGVVDGPTAHRKDYSYSNALASFNKTWDAQSLSEFLEKPKKYVEGTKMAYAGMKKPEDRASLIMYLHSLNDNPKPLPEPKPVAATPATTSEPVKASDPVPAPTPGSMVPGGKESAPAKADTKTDAAKVPAAEGTGLTKQ